MASIIAESAGPSRLLTSGSCLAKSQARYLSRREFHGFEVIDVRQALFVQVISTP